MRLDVLAVAYRLLDRYGESLVLKFSRYLYRPGSLFDERVEFSCPISDITPDWLSKQIADLPAGWDLALNSLVEKGRKRFLHIPMIDFCCRDFSLIYSIESKEIIGREIYEEMIFFDSGRSYHGYSINLISRPKWIEFMGRLLLLNGTKSADIVDARWVGHRLVGGYSALRWSANSPYYIDQPVRVSNLGAQLTASPHAHLVGD